MKYAARWSDGDYRYFNTKEEAEKYVYEKSHAYRRCDEYFSPVILSDIIPVEDDSICEKCKTPTLRKVTSSLSQCNECHNIYSTDRHITLSECNTPVVEPKSHWYDAF